MVEYLEFKDKEGVVQRVPVKYGYYAMKMLSNHYKGKKTYQDASSDLAVQEPFLFYALKKGYLDEGMDFPFKLTDMEEILDQKFMEIMEMIARMHETEEERKERIEKEKKEAKEKGKKLPAKN